MPKPISDATTILNYLFRQGATPRCRSAADANNDSAIDVADVVMILLHLFSTTGIQPPPPFPHCWIEIITDSLDCGTPPACP